MLFCGDRRASEIHSEKAHTSNTLRRGACILKRGELTMTRVCVLLWHRNAAPVCSGGILRPPQVRQQLRRSQVRVLFVRASCSGAETQLLCAQAESSALPQVRQQLRQALRGARAAAGEERGYPLPRGRARATTEEERSYPLPPGHAGARSYLQIHPCWPPACALCLAAVERYSKPGIRSCCGRRSGGSASTRRVVRVA